jgi:hypothetical protein
MPGRMRDDAIAMVKQEIHCHECNQYVQFELDMSKDGNHVLTCPKCGHEHCRVVRRGRITDDRWEQRNGSTFYINSYSTLSTSATSSATWRSSATTTASFVTWGASGTCSYA